MNTTKIKIISIVGARPQFIKAALLSKALRENNIIQEILVHTGQHYDDNMSKTFFEQLSIPAPDINLGIGGGTHAEQSGAMMIGIEKIILKEKPNCVIVYGDTNSTLAGAITAAKCNVPLIHVEAGLRSFNRAMPEEINRIIADRLSQLLFCPTETAVSNLRQEGITSGVHFVGDIMYDALLTFLPIAQQKSNVIEKLGLSGKDYGLLTIHRAANTDDDQRLKSILQAIGQTHLTIVFPIHPRTQKMLQSYQISLPKNIIPTEPLSYFDMLALESKADCILTDSGGVQKEAYWLGIRCITLREETEWVETVKCGWNKIVGVNENQIISAIEDWHPTEIRLSYYGDGTAADKMKNIIIKDFLA